MPATDLILPSTGELVSVGEVRDGLRARVELALTGTADDQAAVLEAIRRIEGELAGLKRDLSNGLRMHAETIGRKTLRLTDGRKAVVKYGEETIVDPEALAAGLRRAGMPEEQVDEIVYAKVEHKVALVKAKQAAAANPKYARVLQRASTRREIAVSVSIERG